MGVLNKFRDLIGIEEYEDEYDDILEAEEESYRQPSEQERRPVQDRRLAGAAVPAAERSAPGSRTANIVSMQERKVRAITNALKLVVIEPEGFEDCSRLVDSLKSRRPIIVNLEKLDTDLARKIFDFLGGATYALNGNVQKVANNIFVFAPDNVAIDSEGDHQPYNFADKNEDFNPWK